MNRRDKKAAAERKFGLIARMRELRIEYFRLVVRYDTYNRSIATHKCNVKKKHEISVIDILGMTDQLRRITGRGCASHAPSSSTLSQIRGQSIILISADCDTFH